MRSGQAAFSEVGFATQLVLKIMEQVVGWRSPHDERRGTLLTYNLC